MKKNRLNEGLMSAIIGGIMSWAVKRDISKDPEFKKTIATYNSDIARLSKELEDVLLDLAHKKKS